MNTDASEKTPVLQPDADRPLVEAFLAGRDEGVFRELYRRHTPALYLFALRFLRGVTQDAEDAVQESWIRAVESLAAFRWQSSFRTWLFGIAVNCSREILRARPRQVEEAALSQASSSQSIELEQLIRRLPDGCREVFILHDIEGYLHSEIGTQLGIAVGTSKHHLFQARRKLREGLNDHGRK